MKHLQEISASPEMLKDGLVFNAQRHKYYNLYTSMDRAMCMLLTGYLYISNGENWNDKSDRRLMKGSHYYGTCFSCSTMENIAMWMLYSGDRGKEGAMIKIPNSIMNELLNNSSLEPGKFDGNTGAFVSLGNELDRDDFDISLIDVLYYEDLKSMQGKEGKVRISCGEDHYVVNKSLLKSAEIIYKHAAWSYEKECRLVVKLNNKCQFQECSVLRLKLSDKMCKALKDKVIQSPIYNGIDFGKHSTLFQEVEWNL